MTGRQVRVRREKVTTVEPVSEIHAVQNGVGSTTSEEEVHKLNKESLEVESWQFQLLERHESNDLDSYTVAELRQLLRFDILSFSSPFFFEDVLNRFSSHSSLF
ncbi:hypothetical protein M758_UG342000 [Ceratodon purpureus]|nr:hypothetical protein M758_UG342000 [Ceratodon purpureus]